MIVKLCIKSTGKNGLQNYKTLTYIKNHVAFLSKAVYCCLNPALTHVMYQLLKADCFRINLFGKVSYRSGIGGSKLTRNRTHTTWKLFRKVQLCNLHELTKMILLGTTLGYILSVVKRNICITLRLHTKISFCLLFKSAT